jgi:DNA replication protein
MNEFSGFPGGAKSTPIPNVFFTTVLPDIDDLDELKVTLHAFRIIHGKRGYTRFVTYDELHGDPALVRGLGRGSPASESLSRGLNRAVSRGTLLHLTSEREDRVEDLYFLNTEADRRAVSQIESGELELGAAVGSEPAPAVLEQANIFALYEQNIGMLSPIIVEELKEAEQLYPASWVRDAFKEAVDLNKRSWRYIQRILERWAAEGKDDGESRRHTKAESDPEEYYRRYGHFLKR